MFICMDANGTSGVGRALLEAYEDMESDDSIHECTFYEATKIEIEVKIEKKQVPVKVVNKSKS